MSPKQAIFVCFAYMLDIAQDLTRSNCTFLDFLRHAFAFRAHQASIACLIDRMIDIDPNVITTSEMSS